MPNRSKTMILLCPIWEEGEWASVGANILLFAAPRKSYASSFQKTLLVVATISCNFRANLLANNLVMSFAKPWIKLMGLILKSSTCTASSLFGMRAIYAELRSLRCQKSLSSTATNAAIKSSLIANKSCRSSLHIHSVPGPYRVIGRQLFDCSPNLLWER